MPIGPFSNATYIPIYAMLGLHTQPDPQRNILTMQHAQLNSLYCKLHSKHKHLTINNYAICIMYVYIYVTNKETHGMNAINVI